MFGHPSSINNSQPGTMGWTAGNALKNQPPSTGASSRYSFSMDSVDARRKINGYAATAGGGRGVVESENNRCNGPMKSRGTVFELEERDAWDEGFHVGTRDIAHFEALDRSKVLTSVRKEGGNRWDKNLRSFGELYFV